MLILLIVELFQGEYYTLLSIWIFGQENLCDLSYELSVIV